MTADNRAIVQTQNALLNLHNTQVAALIRELAQRMDTREFTTTEDLAREIERRTVQPPFTGLTNLAALVPNAGRPLDPLSLGLGDALPALTPAIEQQSRRNLNNRALTLVRNVIRARVVETSAVDTAQPVDDEAIKHTRAALLELHNRQVWEFTGELAERMYDRTFATPADLANEIVRRTEQAPFTLVTNLAAILPKAGAPGDSASAGWGDAPTALTPAMERQLRRELNGTALVLLRNYIRAFVVDVLLPKLPIAQAPPRHLKPK
jgi:hypothetical protein